MNKRLERPQPADDDGGPFAPSPEQEPWHEAAVSPWILGEIEEGRGTVPLSWARCSARRLHCIRDTLRASWVGYGPNAPRSSWGSGYLVDWLLASLIARENVLLLGPPGVAKTEVAKRVFELLGLTSPKAEGSAYGGSGDLAEFREWWRRRTDQERSHQKYFHYLLSRFTQPDELFGPVEIELLRQGVLVRVNFGLLTGPGVRAAFLDEVFKASGSILNSLLSITNEREYFNWGGMERSDLVTLIGASNELPGGFRHGASGVGAGGEDFNTLHAFLDRFPARLQVPVVGVAEDQEPADSTFALATGKAIEREAQRFGEGRGFAYGREGMPSMNDLLLLGRCCMQQETSGFPANSLDGLFDGEKLASFRRAFLAVVGDLQPGATELESQSISWTLSPRKAKALYKIALAHALVVDETFVAGDAPAVLGPDRGDFDSLLLFWDSPAARPELERQVRQLVVRHYLEGRPGRRRRL